MNHSKWIALIVAAALIGGLSAPSHGESTGILKGKVVFNGDKGKFKRDPINTGRDAKCTTKIGTEEVVLNTKTEPVTIRNVLIQIKNAPAGKYEVPTKPAVMDQKGCQYTPHVVALMEGQELEIRNSDDTNHNIHFLPKKNEEFNRSQPKQGLVDKLKLITEEPFKVKCDVHPWMGAHIAVFNHPFFAVTSIDGTFEIKNLPPGKYTVEAWQEDSRLGKQTMEVEIKEDETVEKDITFEPK